MEWFIENPFVLPKEMELTIAKEYVSLHFVNFCSIKGNEKLQITGFYLCIFQRKYVIILI